MALKGNPHSPSEVTSTSRSTKKLTLLLERPAAGAARRKTASLKTRSWFCSGVPGGKGTRGGWWMHGSTILKITPWKLTYPLKNWWLEDEISLGDMWFFFGGRVADTVLVPEVLFFFFGGGYL